MSNSTTKGQAPMSDRIKQQQLADEKAARERIFERAINSITAMTQKPPKPQRYLAEGMNGIFEEVQVMGGGRKGEKIIPGIERSEHKLLVNLMKDVPEEQRILWVAQQHLVPAPQELRLGSWVWLRGQLDAIAQGRKNEYPFALMKVVSFTAQHTGIALSPVVVCEIYSSYIPGPDEETDEDDPNYLLHRWAKVTKDMRFTLMDNAPNAYVAKGNVIPSNGLVRIHDFCSSLKQEECRFTVPWNNNNGLPSRCRTIVANAPPQWGNDRDVEYLINSFEADGFAYIQTREPILTSSDGRSAQPYVRRFIVPMDYLTPTAGTVQTWRERTTQKPEAGGPAGEGKPCCDDDEGCSSTE